MFNRKKNKSKAKGKAVEAPANKMIPAAKNKAVPAKPVKVYCSPCGHIRSVNGGECGHPKNVTEAYWVPGRKVYKPTKELNPTGQCILFEK